MLRPHHRVHGELAAGRAASQDLPDALVLVGGQPQLSPGLLNVGGADGVLHCVCHRTNLAVERRHCRLDHRCRSLKAHRSDRTSYHEPGEYHHIEPSSSRHHDMGCVDHSRDRIRVCGHAANLSRRHGANGSRPFQRPRLRRRHLHGVAASRLRGAPDSSRYYRRPTGIKGRHYRWVNRHDRRTGRHGTHRKRRRSSAGSRPRRMRRRLHFWCRDTTSASLVPSQTDPSGNPTHGFARPVRTGRLSRWPRGHGQQQRVAFHLSPGSRWCCGSGCVGIPPHS